MHMNGNDNYNVTIILEIITFFFSENYKLSNQKNHDSWIGLMISVSWGVQWFVPPCSLYYYFFIISRWREYLPNFVRQNSQQLVIIWNTKKLFYSPRTLAQICSHCPRSYLLPVNLWTSQPGKIENLTNIFKRFIFQIERLTIEFPQKGR